MHHLVGHATSYLARRGADDLPDDLDKQIQAVLDQIPGWGYAVLSLSLIACVVVSILVSYTLYVVFTLACVETPQHAIIAPNARGGIAAPAYSDTAPLISEEATDILDDEEATGQEDPELLVMGQRPITSSIRKTVRLLTSVGGAPGRWRGFSLWLVWSLLTIISTMLLGFATTFVSSILVRIIFCTWEMAWTHIVISDPSPKYWYQRLPKLRTWTKIWLPTAITELVVQGVQVILALIAMALKLDDPERIQKGLSAIVVVELITLFLINLILWFVFIVPANVALKRVQSSMLPAAEKTIVSVDRTFGKPVVSEHEGGSGKLSYRDAWKSVGREVRWRIVKLVIKTVLIELVLVVIFGIIFGLEAVFILAPAIRRARPEDGDPPSIDMGLH